MKKAAVPSILVAVVLLALVVTAKAQQPKKIPRIAYLAAGDATSNSARAEAIRLALRGLGYIEGQNIASEYRYAEGKQDRLPELAADLVRLKVDIIVAAGGFGPIRAAKNATKAIPIIMVGAGPDPVEAGFLALGVTAEPQQPKKVPRIGYLSAVDPASESARAEGIRLALRERGYIEGQNIAIEYRYTEGKRDRFSELAAELVRLKVDIIVVAGGDPQVRAVKNATKTIPIVMAGLGPILSRQV